MKNTIESRFAAIRNEKRIPSGKDRAIYLSVILMRHAEIRERKERYTRPVKFDS